MNGENGKLVQDSC